MKTLFEGTISCKAVLESRSRPLYQLYLDPKKKTKDFHYIESLARSLSCPVQKTPREILDQMASSRSHGGILLEAGEKKHMSLVDLKERGFLCYIDGVEDPYNLGSIMRTLYAMNAQALILPERDWTKAETVLLRASAGAYEKLPLYWIDQDNTLLQVLEEKKIPLLLAHRKNSVSLDTFTFPENFCLCIGGALRGISKTLEAHSSQNIFIPYGRDFRNALDTPSAVSIFAYAIHHQQKGNHNI